MYEEKTRFKLTENQTPCILKETSYKVEIIDFLQMYKNMANLNFRKDYGRLSITLGSVPHSFTPIYFNNEHGKWYGLLNKATPEIVYFVMQLRRMLKKSDTVLMFIT